MNPVFDQFLTKIDRQSEFQTAEPEVGERLHFENLVVVRHRFAFNDDERVNQKLKRGNAKAPGRQG